MNEVNKEYIFVVLKQSNGDLELVKEKITNDYIDILDKLQEMCKNPNRTLLDMQQCFERVFYQQRYLNVCMPYSYSASYISGASYPRILKYDEYNSLLREERKSLRMSELTKEEAEQKINKYKCDLKNNFLVSCTRYIQGYNFEKTSSKIKNNTQIIMQSTEKIGWTNYEYKVNDDVIISISTNFGYGYSSYFILSMKYKDIDILPYSAIIHYYHANIFELRRYTRQYNLERESWNIAFDFVVESVNMAKNNPSRFINYFIVNEINEMVQGLKNIANHPTTEIKRFINKKFDKTQNGFCYSVKNIGYTEAGDYEVYACEMDMAFKAEKITGALFFLERLSELSVIFPYIQTAIEDIKDMNNKLKPEIERKIIHIQTMIEEHQVEIANLEKNIETLHEQIAIHEEKMKNLQELSNNQEQRSNIKDEYKFKNPDYDILCLELSKVQQKLSDLKTHIYKRNNYWIY